MLNGVLAGTQSISEGFEDMAKVVIAQILKLLAYQAIAAAFGGTSGSVLNQIGNSFANGGAGLTASAMGNVFSGGNVIPFARGGIVNGPTIFPMAKGMGLMGEAGPEAVLPLSRGANGKLGVAGGGMNVTVNNMAAGVEVKPRQTDQGLTIDVVMRQVSQAIQRGGNEVSDSMERAYSLGRGRGVY
jgi:lambda family phage tail tape measure protein